MADDIDIANDFMDRELSQALDRIRQHASSAGKGAEFCIECGDSIPKARQEMGYKLCVSCAEQAEREGSLFA
ncbi:MAG: TraR/DksA family transcriptional regulator [Gammaproteobacteria bacterium]|nr:MAG: TraR/DksA family transcriptional regulator [Gammaproteobacteria bacterium]